MDKTRTPAVDAPPMKPKPPWLRRRLPRGPEYERVRALLKKGRLQTVCEAARCPNIWECLGHGTATLLLLGPRCTRACTFCAVEQGRPAPPDPGEPRRAAQLVRELGLQYVVLTAVTRDDLPDGGAAHLAACVRALRDQTPSLAVEMLVPDFGGALQALNTVLAAGLRVLNHNLETVPRRYPVVRPQADYGRSLALLDRAREEAPHTPTKSGLMLGLGETETEIHQVLQDMRAAGVALLTLGQYLQPSSRHLPVQRYVAPGEFDAWRGIALKMGFKAVASGPLVRSSYQAQGLAQAAAGGPARLDAPAKRFTPP